MATLVGLIQGIIAGISLLAVSVGLLYLTSFNGGMVRFVVDGTVVEIRAEQTVTVAAAAERLEAEDPVPVDDELETVDVAASDESAVENSELPSAELPAVTEPAPLTPAVAMDYYDLVAPDLSAMVVSLGRLSSLLANARPEEEGWRSDVTQLIDVVRGGHEHLSLLVPPADAMATHTYLLDVTGLCLGVTDSLSGDILQIPADLFPLVGQAFQRCTSEARVVAETLY